MIVLTGKPKCESIWQSCAKLLRRNMVEYHTFIRNGKPFTRRLVKTNITHNKSHSRIYSTWKNMRYRCSNPKRPKFEYYGGKGIVVCEEWNSSFENFYEWAINNGYSDNLTIDRIDSNGNYCPENCQWIPFLENVKKALSKEHAPDYIYYGENSELKKYVIFYKIKEFTEVFGIDGRRVSECCLGKRQDYKGWIFKKRRLTAEERQETIRKWSTAADEFRLEVRDIQMDDDIVHPA